MSSYVLSMFVAFMVLSVILNIIENMLPESWISRKSGEIGYEKYIAIAGLSVMWIISIPLLICFGVVCIVNKIINISIDKCLKK